jgi:hypothetical protein
MSTRPFWAEPDATGLLLREFLPLIDGWWLRSMPDVARQYQTVQFYEMKDTEGTEVMRGHCSPNDLVGIAVTINRIFERIQRAATNAGVWNVEIDWRVDQHHEVVFLGPNDDIPAERFVIGIRYRLIGGAR